MAESTLKFIRIQQDELDPGPLPVPFQDSTMGPFTHWKQPWIRLTADDGTVGQAPGLIHPTIRHALLEATMLTPQQWWEKLFWMLRNDGHRNPAVAGSLYAIDMAMRDILAKRAGLPWHRYMGAERDEVPVYGSGGGINLSLEDLVEEMCDLVRCGFNTLKMKIGRNSGSKPKEDAERVAAVRRALDDDYIALAVDANQVWTAEQALQFARRIEELNIAWFEEPVHSADRKALSELCEVCPIPVAMGESENHPLGFRDMIECGVKHPQPAPHCLPGFDRWRDAVGFAEAANVTWSSGGTPHFNSMYVATRPEGMVEYLRPINETRMTCFSIKPVIENGMLRLPDRPGLPVEVDWEHLRATNCLREVFDDRQA